MEGESSTKRPKLSGAAAAGSSSTDRISTLPDDVIYSVLSLLPTKNSIATSVLSKRWRYVWAHVPNIDLDSAHVGGASFPDIVYRVMLMYKVQNMNTFRLSYKYTSCSEYQLETCIATAIVRNVHTLHLDLSGGQVRLPLRIFACKTLADLRLYGCGNIPKEAVHLPALLKLHLEKVRYECDKSLAHLLSGCPLLRELYIERWAVDPLVCCSISSQTLTNLTLKTSFVNDGSYTETYSVKIDAPALRRLVLWDIVSKELSCGPLTSLLSGQVRLLSNVPTVLNSRSTLELVGRLTNVEYLSITTSWLEVPQSAFLSSSTMKFRNLTRLWMRADCRFLANFLAYADNLEYLQIVLDDNDKSCGSWLPSPVPTCLSSRLERVRIQEFKCTPNEYTMIAYFLRNAKVLKNMDVRFPLLKGAAHLKAKNDALNRMKAWSGLMFHVISLWLFSTDIYVIFSAIRSMENEPGGYAIGAAIKSF